jgi:hypothetical protein
VPERPSDPWVSVDSGSAVERTHGRRLATTITRPPSRGSAMSQGFSRQSVGGARRRRNVLLRSRSGVRSLDARPDRRAEAQRGAPPPGVRVRIRSAVQRRLALGRVPRRPGRRRRRGALRGSRARRAAAAEAERCPAERRHALRAHTNEPGRVPRRARPVERADRAHAPAAPARDAFAVHDVRRRRLRARTGRRTRGLRVRHGWRWPRPPAVRPGESSGGANLAQRLDRTPSRRRASRSMGRAPSSWARRRAGASASTARR